MWAACEGGAFVRARQPDVEGYVQCGGVKIGYEVFGDAAPTLLLLPAWTISTAVSGSCRCRTWPAISGSSRSTGPATAGLTGALIRMHTGWQRSPVRRWRCWMPLPPTVRCCQPLAGRPGVAQAGRGPPGPGAGAILIDPALGLDPEHAERAAATERFFDPYPADPQRWQRLNARYWQDNYEGFADFFFRDAFPSRIRPSSTRTAWAGRLETTPEVLLTDVLSALGPDTAHGWAKRVSVPALVIHGGDDRISPLTRAQSLASDTGGELVVLEAPATSRSRVTPCGSTS